MLLHFCPASFDLANNLVARCTEVICGLRGAPVVILRCINALNSLIAEEQIVSLHIEDPLPVFVTLSEIAAVLSALDSGQIRIAAVIIFEIGDSNT